MMWTYILKLVILLPLVCGLMIGCLYLWRRLEARMPGQPATRMIAVKETMMISPGLRLAVIDFEGRRLLVSVGRGGVALYAGDTACPLVGRVSMDLLTVDVTELATVPAELEILNARQGVDALAGIAGTIGYEILTSLGDRYERVYKGAAPRLDPE